jgi:hypothetical protein
MYLHNYILQQQKKTEKKSKRKKNKRRGVYKKSLYTLAAMEKL